jgi:hypothetical protein
MIHGICWLLIDGSMVLLEECPKKAAVLGVGQWFVPGGKIEGDESPEDALVREVREEWGVDVTSYTALPVLEGSAIPPGPRGLFLMRPFRITIAGNPPAKTVDEGVKLAWWGTGYALRSPVLQVRMMVAAAIQ